MSRAVRVERDGPVFTVVLSRPQARNAVDKRTSEELAAAFREFESSDAAVAVLYGEGGHFCAGADLKAIAAGEPNRLEPDGDGPMGPTRMNLSKPVIAAIEGFAVAGGLELALWCDLRVVADDAVMGVFCRRFGVPLIDGGTVRLPRLIGHSRSMDLILTGRAVSAEEAVTIGLANRVVPSGKVREAAEQLAREIAAFPIEVMLADRMSARSQWGLPEEAALQQEFDSGLQALGRGGIGGTRAFAEGQGRHGAFDET